MNEDLAINEARERLGLRLHAKEVLREGRLVGLEGLTLRAVIPGVRVGDRVVIEGEVKVDAEAVGFNEENVVLMPLGDTRGLGPGDRVRSAGTRTVIGCGPSLLGRVIDASGQPIDGGEKLMQTLTLREVDARPMAAMERGRVGPMMVTGVRVLDGLMSLAKGQRVGLFSAAGVGKTSLLVALARQVSADVVVIGLVGERGREVIELVDALGDIGRARSVIVVATSDAPALVRVRAAQAATTVAEHFRDEGASVLLLVDSLTRVARAQREVGIAAGEPTVRRGLPPSVYAVLPRLIERAGPAAVGAITGVYSVLVEGSDLDEPVADEVRGLLDGHIVLDRAVAERGRFPAVDVGASVSRCMNAVVETEHMKSSRALRAMLSVWESKRELVAMGVFKNGVDARADRAIAKITAIESFLSQEVGARSELAETLAEMQALTKDW